LIRRFFPKTLPSRHKVFQTTNQKVSGLNPDGITKVNFS
jgi:hypothetical protein